MLAPALTASSPTRDQHVFPRPDRTLNFSAAWLHLSRIIAASLSRQTSKHRAAMNQLDHHSINPPKCLAGFVVTPAARLGVWQGGHSGSLIVAFRVSCACGSPSHFVNGYRWKNPDYHNVDVFLSPIELRCASCNRTALLIDTDIHGHDGEMSCSCTARGEGTPSDFACTQCGIQAFEVFSQFSYPDDLFEPELDKFRGRESDLFDWFDLCGVCMKCGQLREITDFECA